MRRLIKKWAKNREEGITGLETAIILIAFVIVASVFAYVALSAGLFSSQKLKGAINSGLETAGSVVELKGSVIAKMEDSLVKEVYLFVGTAPGSNGIDFASTENSTNTVVISYSDADIIIPSTNWTMERVSSINEDNLLDYNELFMITVDLANSGNFSSANVSIGPYQKFSLEVKPPTGPSLTIERSIPGRVSQYVNLH